MVVVLRAVVVNFYAPWCPWCQRLEPTWEAVTQEVHQKYPDSDGRIRFAKARARAHPCHYHCCAATATQQCRHALCAQPLAPCNARAGHATLRLPAGRASQRTTAGTIEGDVPQGAGVRHG